MREKIIWASFFVVVFLYYKLINDPLESTIGFILGGVVPGTNITLGFWSMILVCVALLLLARGLMSHIKEQALQNNTKLLQKNKHTTDPNNKLVSGDVTKDKSVIAAPTF